MATNKVALIIPAYNEAERIGRVIEPAKEASVLGEIIVVDDGSYDQTSEVALSYSVPVVEHPINLGKGEAMQTGVTLARELGAKTLLFLDADLHGLRSDHIEMLVNPVRYHEAIMTIGILERSLIQRSVLRHWGALSGQRAMTLNFWDQLTAPERHGFRVEASLNASARHHGQHHSIRRLELRHVTHTGKREKEPTLAKATIAYGKTYGSAVFAYARKELSTIVGH